MGVTTSIAENSLVPDWVDKLVQPDFHGRLRSRKFLDSLRKANTKRGSNPNSNFRWSHAGLTYCLTESEVEALSSTLRDLSTRCGCQQ